MFLGSGRVRSFVLQGVSDCQRISWVVVLLGRGACRLRSPCLLSFSMEARTRPLSVHVNPPSSAPIGRGFMHTLIYPSRWGGRSSSVLLSACPAGPPNLCFSRRTLTLMHRQGGTSRTSRTCRCASGSKGVQSGCKRGMVEAQTIEYL